MGRYPVGLFFTSVPSPFNHALSGRKKLALWFCITYFAACICTLTGSLSILVVGRVLGGFSTSILFSVFESWLVSSANSLAVSQTDLSNIMGRATLLNGFVATASGVFSNRIVDWTDTFTSPFVSSAVLLIAAWFAIKSTWIENYGGTKGEEVGGDFFQLGRLRQAWRIARSGMLASALLYSLLNCPRTSHCWCLS